MTFIFKKNNKGRQKKYPMPNGAVYSDVKSDDQRRKVRIKFSNQTEVNLFLDWAKQNGIEARQYVSGENEVHAYGVGYNGAENAIVVMRD